jgi:hypothetical protein
MVNIDITMTAVLRPGILNETLKNIVKHVVDNPNRFRLIINIDPIGEKVEPKEVIDVCRKHFKNVVYNVADKPSFSKAVKWVWESSDAPYVFHWEDDVNILRSINIKDMIRILHHTRLLSSLRLYTKQTPNKKYFKTFSCYWRYNEKGFYIAKDWRRQFGLNPILIKKAFIDEAVKRMVDHVNPEKQFRNTQVYMAPLIKKWKYGLYTKPGDARLVNGRKGQQWKNKMKLQKPRTGKFLAWDKR